MKEFVNELNNIKVPQITILPAPSIKDLETPFWRKIKDKRNYKNNKRKR